MCIRLSARVSREALRKGFGLPQGAGGALRPAGCLGLHHRCEAMFRTPSCELLQHLYLTGKKIKWLLSSRLIHTPVNLG